MGGGDIAVYEFTVKHYFRDAGIGAVGDPERLISTYDILVEEVSGTRARGSVIVEVEGERMIVGRIDCVVLGGSSKIAGRVAVRPIVNAGIGLIFM